MEQKIVYFQDELNDDFAEKNIEAKKIDGKYKYIHKCLLWRFLAVIVYRNSSFSFIHICKS